MGRQGLCLGAGPMGQSAAPACRVGCSSLGASRPWLGICRRPLALRPGARLVLCRPAHLIDDEHFNRAFCRFQLQAELLLNRGKEIEFDRYMVFPWPWA